MYLKCPLSDHFRPGLASLLMFDFVCNCWQSNKNYTFSHQTAKEVDYIGCVVTNLEDRLKNIVWVVCCRKMNPICVWEVCCTVDTLGSWLGDPLIHSRTHLCSCVSTWPWIVISSSSVQCLVCSHQQSELNTCDHTGRIFFAMCEQGLKNTF